KGSQIPLCALDFTFAALREIFLRFDFQSWELAGDAVEARISLTNLGRTHAPIKPRRIRISHDLHRQYLQLRSALHRVEKQRLTDARANRIRSHPHVLELRLIAVNNQRVEPSDLSILFRDINVVVVNEI